jgi:hypothetical protein
MSMTEAALLSGIYGLTAAIWLRQLPTETTWQELGHNRAQDEEDESARREAARKPAWSMWTR